MLLKASKSSLFLSLLFVVVYTACNHITALRSDIMQLNFPWEAAIPFMPALILPYLSLDLFFIAAPFLMRDDRELKTYSRRIAAVTLIAAFCFLLFPMKFVFLRPHVDGFIGMLFNEFRAIDLPFNEFPSLHIALTVLVGNAYLRHTRGLLRALLALWFVLILISVVPTYQHHIIDVLGGILLAAMAIRIFPADPAPAGRNLRIAAYYAIGLAVLLTFAVAFRPWGLLLLWPSASLALIVAAYLGAGAAVYRKLNGRLSISTWLWLWPVLLGQRLSLRHYARQCDPWNPLTGRIFIGRQLSAPDARRASAAGVIAVLDLTCEFSEPPAFRSLRYLSLPTLDLTAPSPSLLEQALAFIDRESEIGIVYIHCKAGYSRTAAVAGAWLLHSGQVASAAEAIARIKQARPACIIRPEARAAVESLARSGPAAALTPQAVSE
jgi:membrane-associated phospholipid phosphatase